MAKLSEIRVSFHCDLCGVHYSSAGVAADAPDYEAQLEQQRQDATRAGWIAYARHTVERARLAKWAHYLCPICAPIATPAVRERLLEGQRALYRTVVGSPTQHRLELL